MKVNHYYREIQEDFYVYLPMRCYELCITHKMLDRLGAISLLFLDALDQFSDQGIAWVQQLTGLSGQQLYPILNRLYGLGLLTENGQLNQHGQTLVRWKHLLHKQTGHIWLDAQHREHAYFCTGQAPSCIVEIDEQAAYVIRPWQTGAGKARPWPYADWNEDCERQKNRLWRHPEHYLRAVFASFQECLTQAAFNLRDWDLSVRHASSTSEFALQVPIAASRLQAGQHHDFIVSNPVLCLDTYYTLPEDAPPHFAPHQPDDQRLVLRFHPSAHDLDALHPTAHSDWVWPAVSEGVREQAVNHLFHQLNEAPTAYCNAVFNRQHHLKEYWQYSGFNWSCIQSQVQTLPGVHSIQAKEEHDIH